MQFTSFHIIAFVLLLLCYALICVLIFLKFKQKELALILYSTNTIFMAILIYSVLTTISEFTTQASLSKLTYARDLRTESLIVSGRVQNLTKYDIKKCYLHLSITNKKHVGGEVFADENLKNATMKNTSTSYVIEIAHPLPGNTYKEFSAKVPFPPNFDNAEFYHTLECI